MGRRRKTAESFLARLQISRTSGTYEIITIQVDDKISGCRLLELEMGLGEFAQAITGRLIECEGTAYMGCPVNAKYEHRQIPIVVDGLSHASDPQKRQKSAEKLLGPHEVEGWTGTPDDLWNWHRVIEGSKPRAHNVTFYRWIDATTGEPIND